LREPPGWKERSLALCRLLLGVVFLVAGIQKVGNPLEFSLTLANYDLLPAGLEMPLAVILPRLEILIGLCLVSGLFVGVAATLCVTVSGGFGLFVASAIVRGLDIECGCFSGAGRVNWMHLALDGVLLALGLALIVFGPDRWTVDRRLPGKTAALSKPAILCVSLVLVLATSSLTVEGGKLTRSPLWPTTPQELSIDFDPPELNLGRVPIGETVERTVVYRNNGSSPLYIVWVQSSCKCTVPQPDKRELAPGESGKLRITFKATSAGQNPDQIIKVYQRGNKTPALLRVNAEVVIHHAKLRDMSDSPGGSYK
jgi:putative oxidoreductase